MDWKAYYRNELTRPGARERIDGWLRTSRIEGVSEAVARRAILSFPHTALDFAGPLQAAVVSALIAEGIERIVALGVLHSGGLSSYRVALDERAALDERVTAFRAVSGAFLRGASEIETPFGLHPAVPLSGGPVRTESDGLLSQEFSLDTFGALLRRAADVFDCAPMPILPLFVGMTRHPATGSFETALEIADWLREVADEGTAVVTTGDLVHYGTAYGLGEEGAPEVEISSLERHFRARVSETLDRAMTQEGVEAAYQASRIDLKNDQREILPVIAAYLGAHARADVLSFELSGYAPILSVDDPCVVASALVSYG